MADDPTDEIDVTSLTTRIQQTLQSDLLPDLKAVTDLSETFTKNLTDANSAANIDITGLDNIKAMQASLLSSESALEQSMKFAKDFRLEISQATDLTEARQILLGEQYSTLDKIDEAQEKIKNITESEIPAYQQKIQAEQGTLDLMTKGTPVYEEQVLKLAEMEETLLQKNAALSVMNGQLVAATQYQDEFLAGQEIMLDNTQDMTQYQFDVRQAVGATIQESSRLLEVNKEIKDELEGMYGDQMQNFMKKYGGMVDEVMGGFDKITSGIDGFLGKIPLIGGMLQKFASGPLEEAAGIAKKALGGALKESFKIMKEGGSVTEAISGGISSFVGGLQGLGSALSSLLSGPFLLIAAMGFLLKVAFDKFVHIEHAARDFRKEMGFTSMATAHIKEDAIAINKELQHQGVSLDDAFKASSSLQKVFSNIGMITKEDTALVAQMNSMLGISTDTSAGALEKFRMMGSAAGEQTQNLMKSTVVLAEMAGVAPGQVMEDIANASDTVLTHLKGTPRELAKAAIEARRMGSSLEAAASALESMIDFEGSMNKEMALSSMMGRHISLDTARRLAWEGDTVGLQKEQLRILNEMGGTDALNPIQLKAAAEALGMSVSEMKKMEKSQQDRLAWEKEFPEEAAKYHDAMKEFNDEQNMNAAQLYNKKMQEQLQQEKMNQLKQKFNEMMVKLGSKLLPMIEVGMEILVPILSTIFDWIGYILAPFKWLGWFIGKIKEWLTPVVDELKKLAQSLGLVGDTANMVYEIIGGIIGLIIFFGFIMKPMFTWLWAKIKGMFTGLMDMVKSAADGIGGSIKKIFEGVGKAMKSIGDGIAGVAQGIGKGIEGLTKGIAKGIQALIEGIGKGLQSISDLLGNMLKSIGDGIAGLADGVGRALSSLGQAVANVATSIGQGIAGLADGIGKALSSLGKAVADVATEIGRGVAGLADGLGKAIASLAQGIGEGIASILQGVGEGVESLIRSLSNLSVKDMLKAAIGLIALAAALWITAKALQEFESVSWGSVGKGIVVLGALSAAAVALGNVGTQILKGAFAVAVLGASLIPAAYAFGLLADVSWGAVWGAIAAIAVLAVVAGILGAPPILGFVLLGALAIGALGLAMIPFAVAALIAGYAAGLVADAFVKMAGALSELTLEQVGVIFALGLSFAFLGGLLPLIIMGAISLGVIAIALAAFGSVAELVAPGIALLADGFDRMVESFSKITLENVATLALLGVTVAGLGLLIVPIFLGAVAMGVMAVALGALGLAAFIAAPGLALLATVMTVLGESLTHITLESVLTLGLLGITILGFAALAIPAMIAGVVMFGLAGAITILGGAAMIAAPALAELNVSLNPMLDKMVAISAVAGDLMFAAAAIGAVGFALAGLGIGGAVGEVAGAVGSFVGGAIGKVGSLLGFNEDPAEKEDPLDKMIRLGKHGKDLQAAADAITRLSDLEGLSSSVGEALGGIADGIGHIAWTMLWAGDVFANTEGMENLTNMLNTFAAMSTNAEGLIQAATGIQAIGEALSSLASGRLSNSIADVAEGVTGFFGSLFGGGDKQEVEKLDPMEQFIRIGEVGPDIEKASNALIKLSEVQFDGSGISSLASGLMKFGDAMRAMTSDDSGGGVGGFFSRLFGKKQKKKESPLDKLMTSLSAFADVTKAMGPGAETMARILTGLGTIASESFVTGMARATDSIYAFVAALSTIPDNKAEVFAEVASAAISGSEARAVEQSHLGGSGVPVEEMGGLGDGPTGTTTVTETLASVETHPNNLGAQQGPTTDMSTTEANLAELISLMKSGGIAVYLDSKKVSKQLAAAAEE